MFSVFPLEPKIRSCTVEAHQHNSEEISGEKKHFHLEDLTFDLAFPHLQSGGMAAEVGRVDKAEAKHSNVATVEGSDVT